MAVEYRGEREIRHEEVSQQIKMGREQSQICVGMGCNACCLMIGVMARRLAPMHLQMTA
jgi:hypothetical protein